MLKHFKNKIFKKRYLSLIFIFIGLSESFASNEDLSLEESVRHNLSAQSLRGTYEENKDGKIDVVLGKFYQNMIRVKEAFKNLKASKGDYKVKKQKNKDLLVFIVESVQWFSENIDGGQSHYYGFAKLYEEMPKDLSFAIHRSSLNKDQKCLMFTVLKNTIEPK